MRRDDPMEETIPISWLSGWVKKDPNRQHAHAIKEMVSDHYIEQTNPQLKHFLDDIVTESIPDAPLPRVPAAPVSQPPAVPAPPAPTVAVEPLSPASVGCVTVQEKHPGKGRVSISLFSHASQPSVLEALLPPWIRKHYLPELQQIAVGLCRVPVHIGLAALYFVLLDRHMVSLRVNISAYYHYITAFFNDQPCTRQHLNTSFRKVRLCEVDSLSQLTLQKVQEMAEKYVIPGYKNTWKGMMPHEFTTHWDGLYEAVAQSVEEILTILT